MSPALARGRWSDVVLSFVTVRLVIWVALLGLAVPGWITGPFNLMDYMDDHQHYSWDLVGYKSYLEFHQFPLWNPYWCGGNQGLAEPESTFLAPDFLVKLAFGVARGRHLVTVVAAWLGLEGVFRLCRKLGSSGLGALFAASVYGTQYVFISFVHDGALNLLLGFELLPWVLYCFFAGHESVAHRLLGGFFVAWLFLSGGTYPTPYTVFLLGILTVVSSVQLAMGSTPRRWTQPWASTLTIGTVALLLGAAKLLPLLGYLRQFKRTWTATDAHTAQLMFTELTGNYPWLVFLAFVGIVYLDRVAATFGALAVLFFLLSMGDFDPASPYHLLKALPLISQLRCPERYALVTILFLGIAAAKGITALEDSVPALLDRLSSTSTGLRTGRIAVKAVRFAAVGLSSLVVASVLLPRARSQILTVPAETLFTWEPAPTVSQPFRQYRGNRRDIHVFTAANGGSLRCIYGMQVYQSPALRADLPAEEYPVDPASAVVTRLRWTPNEVELDVDARAAARVVVNQNWNKHFRANVGRVVAHQGLLAVDVPAGRHRLIIRYVDRLFTLGLVISSTTLLVLLGLAAWLLVRRTQERWSEVRALPWVAGYGADP